MVVPFPPSQYVCTCKYTCQCLLTWRHHQRVLSHCFGKLWLWGDLPISPISYMPILPISYNVYGPFGEHLRRPKIAHESHNDVRRLLLAELGLRKPPSGNPEGIGLLGEEGCTFPLPLWSSNRRESGETEIVYSAYIREGKGLYGRERASIRPPSRGGRLQISPPL